MSLVGEGIVLLFESKYFNVEFFIDIIISSQKNSYINYYRYWLFGEKEQETVQNVPIKRIRGWFPRPCAIEIIGNNQYFSKSFKSD